MTAEEVKLVRENENLQRSLRTLINILEHKLNEPWIEVLHAVQEAKVLLGDIE